MTQAALVSLDLQISSAAVQGGFAAIQRSNGQRTASGQHVNLQPKQAPDADWTTPRPQANPGSTQLPNLGNPCGSSSSDGGGISRKQVM